MQHMQFTQRVRHHTLCHGREQNPAMPIPDGDTDGGPDDRFCLNCMTRRVMVRLGFMVVVCSFWLQVCLWSWLVPKVIRMIHGCLPFVQRFGGWCASLSRTCTPEVR